MTKLVKGGKIQPFITGDDVIITKNTKHPLETVDEAFESVDNTLDEHQKEIDKLKSNLKYVYSYGGVGGKGSGGSGGGGSADAPRAIASLNSHKLTDGGNAIILNGSGSYTVDVSVSNSQGKIYVVEILYGNRTMPISLTLSTERNKCRDSINITLNANGKIKVTFYDQDGYTFEQIEQYYIVNPHTFDTKFMYEFDNGTTISDIEFTPYEYFVGNSSFSNPFLYAEYQIDVQNVSNVSLTYSVGGVTFDTIDKGSVTKDSIKIYLDTIIINGKPITHESNTGKYTVSITLKYTSNATEQGGETKSFDITIIPDHLYINVRNAQNLIYDTLEDLREAKNRGIGGIPEKNLSVGTYTSFYCKIFESSMITTPQRYTLTLKAYDVTIGPEPGDEVISDVEAIDPINRPGVVEQQETPEPLSVVFGTPGIKMLVFSTKGQKNDVPDGDGQTVKYIFVKERVTNIKDWYPEGLPQNNFYFRANSGNNTYSQSFPQLPSNEQPWELSESGNEVTLTDPAWGTPTNGYDTTILSFGIQYSAVNSDSAVILKTYSTVNTTSSDEPDITLSSDSFYSKKICIPTENNFDKTITTNYHLVQIVRHKIGFVNTSTPQWGTYLYIDGKPEANNATPDDYKLVVKKIVFSNVNIVYNLINLQYIQMQVPDAIKADRTAAINTIDGLIYQYYLAYKDIMGVGTVTESEKKLFDDLDDIKFDGTDVIVNKDFVTSVSPFMPIPTLMMEFTNNDPAVVSKFKEDLFKGYRDNETKTFGTKNLTNLYWCSGLKYGSGYSLKAIEIPQITDENESYGGFWQVELQGTSTMKNRIKNFSLILRTNDEKTHTKKLLMSPNYSSEDPRTFLPEQIWTLKADIADSAHANNTSIGKFVNRVCTPFSSSLGMDSSISPYIKNTLEGFPVLMYFKIGEDVYYLGVYNFNMGRESYYNLGYVQQEQIIAMKNRIQLSADRDIPFAYSVGNESLVDGLAIGEVQDNNPEFDFHQFQHNVLFNDSDDNDGRSTMFGKDSKITPKGSSGAKTTLENFVKSVAVAGAYCFANIGKRPKSSKSNDSNNCVNRYELDIDGLDEYNNPIYTECVPDLKYQFMYEGTTKKWLPEDTIYTFDNIRNDVDNLLQCISSYDHSGVSHEDFHYLDYTSASEYYTVCMAFGLVDSILKNMNIKSWDYKKCFVAFYDMDCALGENNAGAEVISYLAATDFWYSNTVNGYLQPVDVKYDYWNTNNTSGIPYIGPGFDYPSSYLFAIVKYAQPILGNLGKYPQQFWAEMRQKNGELRNADHFISNYFSSGIGEIPSYLAALNYQVKYLYTGTYLDANNDEREGFLANQGQFNGTRIWKVKDWLNKRFHFLDVMFNVQNISYPIGNKIYNLPSANTETLGNLSDDVIILSDAFTLDENSNVIISSNDIPVDVYAPQNTPFIAVRGKENPVYILTAPTGEKNTIMVNTTSTQSVRFLGSTEFTKVSRIEPFLNTSNQISSNRLEEIVYSGLTLPNTNIQFTINSTSVKKIKLDIPTFSGTLMISNDGLNGKALSELNISQSGFTGTWDSLTNLKVIDISSVNSPNGTITVSNCPLVGDGYSSISGLSTEKLTTLNTLNLLGVSGNFTLINTKIKTIHFSANDGEDCEFSINGDVALTELNLSGFKSVVIKGCPNLEKLTIDEGDRNKCEKIIIEIPEYHPLDGSEQLTLKKFNSNVNGVFDFTKYESLKTLGVSGCADLEVIKLPDHKVSVTTFRDNVNLEFVDTVGQHSIIEIIQGSTFYNCPHYGMRQSWWSDYGYNNMNISETLEGDPVYDMTKYTKMCVKNDDEVKTLVNTFNKLDAGDVSKYTNTSYTNAWGQKVKNMPITMEEANLFIETYVGGGQIDDAYLDNDGVIHDTWLGVVYIKDVANDPTGDYDCRKNIEVLRGCFYKQKGITYVGSYPGESDLPDLSQYRKLKDISMMYYGTNITYLSKELLSLYDGLNNNDDLDYVGPEENRPESNALSWSQFISGSNLKISKDAFEHISYRIDGFNVVQFTVCDPEDYLTVLNTTSGDYLDVVDILCPQKDEHDNIIPFKRITSFNAFNINDRQYVDYRNLFTVCPNVSVLNGFLTGCDLSRAKIDGILYSCENITSISNSFNHMGDPNDLDSVDLYTFFDWTNTDLYDKITDLGLFTSSDSSVGFAVKKHISNVHFIEIMSILHNYDVTRLSNIFSYCTIDGYDGTEIKLSEKMNRVTNINSLFFECKGMNGGNQVPLKIRRSFFKNLPNVTMMANTFCGVWFDHMLSYDFFCKRKEIDDNTVYVEYDTSKPVNSDARYRGAVLHTTGYESTLINSMENCFSNAKFINCDSWFDYNDNTYEDPDDSNVSLRPITDTVTYAGDSSYTSYYRKESGVYVKYDISQPMAYLDTLNNFTNYVDNVYTNINGGSGSGWQINNHKIDSDLQLFGNKSNGYPYDVNTLSTFNITPTYCCLPPDIFHCCSYNCDLRNVFSNTNIIGVIPQHLLVKCYESKLANMFENVNILPNLIYHYEKNLTNYTNEDPDYASKYQRHQDYLTLIDDIDVDNDTITNTSATDSTVYTLVGNTDDDAVVLFRNSNGELKRRYPISGLEYSKSQFVYVPQGYTTNPNLTQAFTFRYNLPQQIDLTQSRLRDEGITWASGSYESYFSPTDRPDLWPYHTQYFFTVDESISWVRLRNISMPFISDEQDVNFEKSSITGLYETRMFSTSNQDYKNVWWNSYGEFSRMDWNQNVQTISPINVFLNLCGERNVRTGQVKDCGCLINKVSNYPYAPLMDAFVSGILGIFLNGRIFSQSVDAGRFTSTSNGTAIIRYTYGFARNMILPDIRTKVNNHPKVLLSFVNSNVLFYKFMFPTDSLQNYKDIFNIPLGNGVDNPGINDVPKYKVYD